MIENGNGSKRSASRPPTCVNENVSCMLTLEVIAMRTTVTSRGQTIIPAKIRLGHRIGPQTELEWIDDGETIRVVPIPPDSIRAAKGISKGLWQRLLNERERERQRG